MAFLGFAAANQVKISDFGGIERIVIAMKRHESCAAVQKKGCAALLSLAANSM